jgi:VanZ family protein
VHQTFVPTREGTLRDVIIDGIGAALAWYTLARLLPKAPRRRKT